MGSLAGVNQLIHPDSVAAMVVAGLDQIQLHKFSTSYPLQHIAARSPGFRDEPTYIDCTHDVSNTTSTHETLYSSPTPTQPEKDKSIGF